MKKKRMIIFFIIIFVLSLQITAYASLPYNGYNYNAWNEAVPSPEAYKVKGSYLGEELGCGNFRSPQDLYVDKNSNIYVLDSGNGRIVVLDSNFNTKKIISKFYSDDGEETLNNPQGIFVTEDKVIYIADRDNNRVLIMNSEGYINSFIERPKSDIIPESINFNPTKVVVNKQGTVYVIVSGAYQGAFSYNNNGDFIGFYGSNRVEPTINLIRDFLWKRILSQEQKSKMVRYVPIEYTNFDLDPEGFVYTCTKASSNSLNEIKKLNPMGLNVLRSRTKNIQASTYNYGDLESEWYEGKIQDTQFIDINIDDSGFINALDYERGRIFQYDQESKLINIFGSVGNQKGTFKSPTAIENIDGKIIVLDGEKTTITVFETTPFGELIHKAVNLYNEGLYIEAIKPWEEVLKRDSNFELAYIGMGEAYYQAERYEEAMTYFEMGYDRDGKSKAFKEYRTNIIRNNFSLYFIIILLTILLFKLISKYKIGSIIIERSGEIKYLTKNILHPQEANGEIKQSSKEHVHMIISYVIIAIWILVTIFERQSTEFIFNNNRIEDFNIFIVFARTILLVIVWSISNWAFCTMLEGKGTLKQIWITSTYSLIPFIIITVLVTILSNFLVQEERIFLEWIKYIGLGWTIILLASGLKTIHMYSLKKTIGSIILTVFGIATIIFLTILIFSLFQQVAVFFKTVYNEIMYRL